VPVVFGGLGGAAGGLPPALDPNPLERLVEGLLLQRDTSDEKENSRSLLPQTDEDEDRVPSAAEPTTDASPHCQVAVTVLYIMYTGELFAQCTRLERTVPSV